MRDTRDTMRQTRRALWLACGMTGCAVTLTVAALVLAIIGLRAVVETGSTDALLPLGLVLGTVVLCAALVEMQVGRLLLRTGLWIDHVLEPRLLQASLANSDTVTTLVDTNRALSEVRDFIVGADLRLLLVLPWLLVSLTACALIEPHLAALAGAVIPLVAAMALGGNFLLRRGLQSQAAASRAVRHGVIATTSYGRDLVGLGLSHRICDVGAARNRSWIAAAFRHGWRAALFDMLLRSVLLAAKIALLCGACLVILSSEAGRLTAPLVLVLAIAVFRTLPQLPEALLRASLAAEAWAMLSDAALAEAADRLFSHATPGEDAAGPPARLELRDVDYIADGSGTPVLQRVSLAIAPGEAILVNGAPGSGKSTIAALLAGGLSPSSGIAMLGDHPVRRRQSLTSTPRIGWYSQEPVLIEGTVAENIVRFTEAGEHGAIECARRAGVYGVLATLANGFSTVVATGGIGLSARQRRAVSLARALHGKPDFLVLDEPETMLDDVAVARLAKTLADMMAEGVGLCLVTRHPTLAALATGHVLLAERGVASVSIAPPAMPDPANDTGGPPVEIAS